MSDNQTLSAHDLEDLITSLREVAQAAGAAIMSHYEGEVATRLKEDNSPVTAADHAAEDIILAGLKKIAPDIPVISEEQAAAGNIPSFDHCFFLVDPLDGTREFLNKNGEFTVNIALIENRVPVAGIVYAPAKDRMFFASGPGQAYEQTIAPDERTGAHPPHLIHARRPDDEGLTIVASRSHRDQKTEEYLNLYKVKEIVAAGSSLKFCLIAAGEADLYPRHGRTMEWDTAAGHAVLNGAGGSVTKMDGSPFLYGKSEDGLANPFFLARGTDGITAG